MATKKAKKFDEGGVVANSNYPSRDNSSSSGGFSSSGLGNTTPLVQINTGATDSAQVMATPAITTPFQMKKGGSVSTSSRGDGIAQRGKTKGRMC